MNVTRFQIDAIPTVGFSDPILKYFSALRYMFDGENMIREGYRKVICFSFSYCTLTLPRTKLMTFLFIDETRFIQNCSFPEMVGGRCRIRASK